MPPPPQLGGVSLFVPPTPQLVAVGGVSVHPTTGKEGDLCAPHPTVGVPLCAPHNWSRGGWLCPIPPPTIGAPICAPHPTMGWSLSMLPTPQLARRGRSLFAPPHPSTGMGGWSLCRPPPQKKNPNHNIWGGEGVPVSVIPMIWVKGRGGSLEIAKPPPQNHTHTHTHVHTHAHAEPPPPPALVLGWGGGIKTFVSDRVPTPSPPPPTLWGRSGGGGGTPPPLPPLPQPPLRLFWVGGPT